MSEVAIATSSFEELTKRMDESDKADKQKLRKLLIEYGVEENKAEELMNKYYGVT